jgi:WD40 repeat protein
MAISGDGRLVATGSEDGMLVLRRLHDLKIVQRFEPAMSAITSLAFSAEGDYIFVGTASGHMLIFAVKCG